LTGDKLHNDHIKTGQRVSRHFLPTLLADPFVFYFFPNAQKILKFFANAHCTHLLLPLTHKPTQRQKQKSAILPTLLKPLPTFVTSEQISLKEYLFYENKV